MFNKKRMFCALVFILLMFFMMTFASGPKQNAKVATRLVTFTDSYDNKEIAKYEVEVGHDATVPENPYHKNFVFGGWYRFEDQNVKVTDFTKIMYDLHVIAKYKGDINNNGIADDEEALLTVTFVDSTTKNVLKTQNVLSGTDATAPAAPIHANMTFVGWDKNYTNVRANIVVNAIYRQDEKIPDTNVNKYKVTFIDGDTEEIIDTQTVEEKLSATTPVVPEHEKRVFDYWKGNYSNVTKDEEVTAIYADDINENGTPDYKETKYTVIYDKGLVDVKGNVPIDTNKYLKNLTYVVKENKELSLENGMFLGWSFKTPGKVITTKEEEQNLSLIQPNEEKVMGESDVILYAIWAEDKNNNGTPDYNETRYTVTYNKGLDNVTGEEPVDNNEYLTGITYKVLSNELSLEKATFIGYVTTNPEKVITTKDEEKTLTLVQPNEEKIIENSNVTYYAVWADDVNNNGTPDYNENKYKVTYNKGLENVTGEEPVDNNEYLTGITYKVLSNELSLEKATFIGYVTTNPEKVITTKDEEKKLTLIQPNELVEMGSSNITYYTVWADDVNNNGIPDYKDNKYVVTFVNFDDNVLKQETVLTGLDATAPTDPTRAKDSQYTYTFNGWDKSFTNVTSDLTIKATYTETINKYKLTINYIYSNGNVASQKVEEEYEYGTTYSKVSPEIIGYTPDNATVSGTITGAVNVTVIYKANTDTKYTVKHYKQNLDGTYPTTPSDTETLSGTTDTKTSAQSKTYEGFTATSFEQVNISGDGTTVVEIKYTRNSYTATFKIDNVECGKVTGKYESTLEVPTTCVAKAGYTLGDWEPIVPQTMPASNTEYNALTTANTDTKYTVKHYKQNLDGTYPTTPSDTETLSGTTDTKTSAQSKTYEGFTATSFEQVNITGDGTTVVEIKYTRNVYTVTFTDGDGKTIDTQKVKYEDSAKTPEKVPAKTKTAQYTYTFKNWVEDYSKITSDLIVTSEFTSTINKYKLTINYIYSNGDVASQKVEEEYEYGTTYSKVSPEIIGYTPDNATVSGTITKTLNVTVTYTANTNTSYVVKHYKQNLDGTYPTTPTDTETLSGTTNAKTTAEAKMYTGFTSLAFEQATIAGDGTTVVEIKYTRNNYTATFKVDNVECGKVTGKYESVLEVPTTCAAPTGYTLGSWNPTVPQTMPAGNVTYSAVTTANTNTSYTVKHYKQNLDGTYSTTPSDTETLNGTTNANTTAEAKTYTGFTSLSFEQATIAGDGTTVVEIKYTRNSYTATFKVDNVECGKVTGKYESALEVPTTCAAPTGYTLGSWNPTVPQTIPASNVTYSAVTKPITNTAYTVKHYKETNGTYTLSDTETLYGTTDELTNATAKTYTGFTAQPFEQVTIKSDGSSLVEIKYDLNTYTITYDFNGGTGSLNTTEYAKYGSIYQVADGSKLTKKVDGYVYGFDGWQIKGTNTIVDPLSYTTITSDITYVAKWVRSDDVTELNSLKDYWTNKAKQWSKFRETLEDAIAVNNNSNNQYFYASQNITFSYNSHVSGVYDITSGSRINADSDGDGSVTLELGHIYIIDTDGQEVKITVIYSKK